MDNRYNYAELEAAATAYNAPKEAIDALGEWFNNYGMDFWNGEFFTVSESRGLFLYPVYKKNGYDDLEVMGYTFNTEDRFV